MNILWHSNASFMPTGYGGQTRTWTHRLYDEGYGIVVSAYRGLEGMPMQDSYGIMHLPRVKEPHSNDVIHGHFQFAQTYYPNKQPTDIVWSLLDIFVMQPATWEVLPWAAWVPIDCEPVLQEERKAFAVCRWPIAMSRHGEAQMKAMGLTPIYVPHGIETQVFTPMDRTLARETMLKQGLLAKPISDDTFLVVVVGNNGIGGRKNFSGMLEAFQLFSHEHPDTLMYIHADYAGVHSGTPLDAMAAQLDLSSKVIFPSSYAMLTGVYQNEQLRNVYNAADVKLMLSMGEGFGLTDVEAEACGCPLIATNFSSSIELNFTGWKVNGPLRQNVPLSYQMIPDSFEAADKLEEAYQLWKAGGMPELRQRTHEAAQVYDVEKVLRDYFIPALNEIQADLERTPHGEWLKQRAAARIAPVDSKPDNKQSSAYRNEIAMIADDIVKGKK